MNYIIKQNSDDVIESIYSNRNLTEDEVTRLLSASEDDWEDPDNYPNMNRAYKCLMKHIKNNNVIYIQADSDVDGLISCSILINFILKYLKYDNVYYLTHKGKQHGITNETINSCIKGKIGLLITPDAASSDITQMRVLAENNIDFISLDHHLYNPDDIPEYSIVVNNQHPNVNNKYGSGSLVTYKFIYYVAEMEGVDISYDYLAEVNIANIGDMCEMNAKCLENRFIYKLGSDLKNNTNEMIRVFAENLNKKKKLTIDDVSFGIVPKMNSIIRMGSSKEKEDVIESLIGSDEMVEYKYRGQTKVQSIYDSIIRISNKLKSQQKREINKYAESLNVLTKDTDKIIIVDGTEINSSLRGLLANKVMGEYQKPTFILSRGTDNILRGSARGIGDKDLNELCQKSNLALHIGGHSMSFGISLMDNNVDKFIKYLNKELMGVDFSDKTEIDYEYKNNIPLEDLLDIADLDDIWTFNCKRPKILIKNIKINSKSINKRGINLSFKVGDILYKRDFCSNVWFSNLICEEDNPYHNKDLIIDAICEVKTTENNKAYINLIEIESEVM